MHNFYDRLTKLIIFALNRANQPMLAITLGTNHNLDDHSPRLRFHWFHISSQL